VTPSGPDQAGQPGLLITFEGPEGSGKTTLIHGLETRLTVLGCQPLLIREPGGTEIGERIRDILLDPASVGMCPETELLLMVASRAQLVREKIRPALAAGRIILCDRFADASVAYQGVGRGLGTGRVDQLNELALNGLRPNLTLLCLLPPEQGRARLRGRRTDRLDQETAAFHERVYQGYRAMADGPDRRFEVIDATAPPEQMLASARERLKCLEHSLLQQL